MVLMSKFRNYLHHASLMPPSANPRTPLSTFLSKASHHQTPHPPADLTHGYVIHGSEDLDSEIIEHDRMKQVWSRDTAGPGRDEADVEAAVAGAGDSHVQDMIALLEGDGMVVDAGM
jgi:hypothetical protein